MRSTPGARPSGAPAAEVDSSQQGGCSRRLSSTQESTPTPCFASHYFILTTTCRRSVHYVNTGWAGPLATATIDAVAAALRNESDVGPASPEGLALGRVLERRCRERLA